ncbi:MAG: RsmE family RNA methyltransferase [Phycisphaerae bacterium]|nr:RsmE family RNA methyltransferase [Phycisphaerae bacterium]
MRFFCETIEPCGDVFLCDVQSRHLTKVLRLSIGDTVELFDGKGAVAEAVVEKISKDKTQLKIQSLNICKSRENQRIIIAPSVAKGQRFELIISKCTELGIDRIRPVIFERTVKQVEGKNALRRYELLTIESAKQCERNFLPVIDEPRNFPNAAEELGKLYPDAKIIFGSLTDGAESIMNLDFGEQDIIAFVGPEGGLTDWEEDMLKKINAVPVRLTDTILRIETAAMAIASILAAKRDSKEQKI